MPYTIGPAELVIVLLVAAMIAVPVVLVMLLARTVAARPSAPTGTDPRAILADRLARGAISRAEFDAAMRALGFTD
jgi:uncharacterized membrane protein